MEATDGSEPTIDELEAETERVIADGKAALEHFREFVDHHREAERLGTALADAALETVRRLAESPMGRGLNVGKAELQAAAEAFLAHQWPAFDRPQPEEDNHA